MVLPEGASYLRNPLQQGSLALPGHWVPSITATCTSAAWHHVARPLCTSTPPQPAASAPVPACPGTPGPCCPQMPCSQRRSTAGHPGRPAAGRHDGMSDPAECLWLKDSSRSPIQPTVLHLASESDTSLASLLLVWCVPE